MWGLGKEQVGAPSDKEFLLDYLQLEIFLRQWSRGLNLASEDVIMFSK